jgi:hypothetical protein
VTDDEFTRVDLGLIEGRRDVNGVDAVGTGFGRGSTPTSEYSVADGWAQVRAVEQDDAPTGKPEGYNGVVNQPLLTYIDSVRSLITISLSPKALARHLTAAQATVDLAEADPGYGLTTRATTSVRPALHTGRLARYMQLSNGLPLAVGTVTRTVTSPPTSSGQTSLGIIKAGGRYWGVKIDYAGVYVSQIPMAAVSASYKAAAINRVKSSEVDPVARMVKLLGGVPQRTGLFDVWTHIMDWPTGTYEVGMVPHPSARWAFNVAGTEARFVTFLRASTNLSGSPWTGMTLVLRFGYDSSTGLPTAECSVEEVGKSRTVAYAPLTYFIRYDGFRTDLWSTSTKIKSWADGFPTTPLPAATTILTPVYTYYDRAGAAQTVYVAESSTNSVLTVWTSQEMAVDPIPPRVFVQVPSTPTPISFLSGSLFPSVASGFGVVHTYTPSSTPPYVETWTGGDTNIEYPGSVAAYGKVLLGVSANITNTVDSSGNSVVTGNAVTTREYVTDPIQQRFAVMCTGDDGSVVLARVTYDPGYTETTTHTWLNSPKRVDVEVAKHWAGAAVAEIIVYGDAEPYSVPVLLPDFTRDSVTTTTNYPDGTTSTTATVLDPPTFQSMVDAVFAQLGAFLNRTNGHAAYGAGDVLVRGLTRQGRYVRLAQLEVVKTGVDGSGNPVFGTVATYEDSIGPAIAATALDTTNGNFSFIGDY